MMRRHGVDRTAISPLGQVIPMYAYPANLPNGYGGEDKWTACSMGTAGDVLTFVVANVADGVVDTGRVGGSSVTGSVGDGHRVQRDAHHLYRHHHHHHHHHHHRDMNYVHTIAECARSGVRLLGYLNLEWGETDLGVPGCDDPGTVLGQVRLWFELYPGIQGVFLDQVPMEGTPAARRYHRAIAANVPGAVVANAGQLPGTDWLLDSGARLVVYENYVDEFEHLRLPSWTSRYSPHHLGAILHDATSPTQVAETCSEARAKGFGFVYITDGRQDSGNPYDGLPSPSIWAALEGSRRSDPRRHSGSEAPAGWVTTGGDAGSEPRSRVATGVGSEP